MTLSSAVVLYDLIVFALLALDFALVSRKNTAVVAKVPALLMAVALAGLGYQVDQRFTFVLVTTTVMLTALFGYANMLAFLKRGITFSILSNHALPPHQRRPDRDFITLAERINEMRGHGWVEGDDRTGWKLTESGRRVLRVRRILMRVLRIEAVG